MHGRIKDIHVVFCTDDDRPHTAIDLALSFAAAEGAHTTIQAVSTKLAVPHSIISNVAAGLITDENRRRLDVAENAVETYRKNALSQGVACIGMATQLGFGEAVATCGREGRLHDLTILEAQPDALSPERAIAEEILFNSGRPVLIVPEGRGTYRLGHAMVAWDGSAQAARALSDALPLLASAKAVNIVSVAEPGKESFLPGSEIAPRLARHGIAATVVNLEAPRGDVETVLREQSHSHRTDLIVMGAYAHSWWREIVLGGVTQSFLDNPPAPVLLSR